MRKGGKYMAPRKKPSHRPFALLAVILILILIGMFFFLRKDNQEIPVSLHLAEKDNPESTLDNSASDVDTLPAYLQATEGKPATVPENFDSVLEVQPTSVFENYYNSEQAMIDGCVVMEDGDLRENQANWHRFVEATQAGEPAAVTVMHYTRDESGSWYIRYEVSFDGDVYTLKIGAEDQQISCTFTGLEMTAGVMNQQNPHDRYIRYTLTGRTETEDVILVEDLISTPDLTNITGIALHLKQGEPPLNMYEDPAEIETILKLLKDAEYEMVPPEGYILGVKLILHTEDAQEVILEVDIIQGVYRYGTRYGYQYYKYGELSDLFQVLGITEWPEEVQNEYYGYLYYS